MSRRLKITMMMSALALGYQMADATPPQEDPPSVVVRFGDLDLTSNDGVTTLYGRLKSAAETVCASQDNGGVEGQMRFRNCWRSALNRAVYKVDRPLLTGYYRARIKGGGSGPIQVAQK